MKGLFNAVFFYYGIKQQIIMHVDGLCFAQLNYLFPFLKTYFYRLANVQEARSRTPVHVQTNSARPETPSQYLTSLSLSLHGSQPPSNALPENRSEAKKMVLEEIRRQRVNSAQRMQSLQVIN